MFGWFKSKNNTKDRSQNIYLTFATLEGTLKAVEGHWSVGNKKKGDEVFSAFFDACMANFVGGPEETPNDLRSIQLDGLNGLIGFTIRHGMTAYQERLVNTVTGHIKYYSQDQRQMLMHKFNLMVEERRAKAKAANTEIGLTYFVCQNCGRLNLVSTAPCLHCGFAAISERDLGRSLLLGAGSAESKFLLSVAKLLSAGANDIPPRRIDGNWPIKNIDAEAGALVRSFGGKFEQLLESSRKSVSEFKGIPQVGIRCLKCGGAQSILTYQMEQPCASCGTLIPVPGFRRLKATLNGALHEIIQMVDHPDSLAYQNFIATFVLILDYSMRRDTPPTNAQGVGLINRFASIVPLEYCGGIFKVRIENGLVVGAKTTFSAVDERLVKVFDQHVSTLNILLSQLSSKENVA